MASRFQLLHLPEGHGKLIHVRDGEDASILGLEVYATNLLAHHYRDGELQTDHPHFNEEFGGIHLGSGLTTNIGAMSMSNDWNWASPSAAAINTLKLANQHASGTGATAAAATDIKIQTLSSNGGQNPVAGTQTTVTAANAQAYRTVATIAYTGTEAVTEWGLYNNATLSTAASIGTPFTATTATSATVTATPLTASSTTVQGRQQFMVLPGTTTVWGLVGSNTTSVYTLLNNGTTGWWNVASGTAGSTPGSTEAYTLCAVLFDHKVFSAINVINGDSVQYTYTLTINSGG